MPDLGVLINHWGYLAIVVVVILGNVGLPVPEESILVLAGYLAWRGDLKLPFVIGVGVISAAAGDNIGYWIGRELGRGTIERYSHWVLVTPERLESVWRFVNRYGPFGVFAARFIPGLRFMAGPLAGAAGLRPSVFLVANLLGAMVYVPCAVGVGFAIGYGLGEYMERLRRVIGNVEHIVLIATAVVVVALVGWRALRAVRHAREH